jgi:pyruvate, orthophosphate dikinase
VGHFPEGMWDQVLESLVQVEEAMGAKFGDASNPLLVSVRSGARVSMPGMMDTVLNIGLNDDTVQGLIRKTSNPRFAYDAYRRFVAMFSNVVLGVPSEASSRTSCARPVQPHFPNSRWTSCGWGSKRSLARGMWSAR